MLRLVVPESCVFTDRTAAWLLGEFELEELPDHATRYQGYRGVIQLRSLVPIVDPRSQSPGESSLRLRWLDHGLPRPECQVAVPAPDGGLYFVDIGLPELRCGAEYEGAEFHAPTHEQQDAGPRLSSAYRKCLETRHMR